MKNFIAILLVVSGAAAFGATLMVDSSGKFLGPGDPIKANNLITTTSGGLVAPLTPGAGLSGEVFNGSAAQTWQLDTRVGIGLNNNVGGNNSLAVGTSNGGVGSNAMVAGIYNTIDYNVSAAIGSYLTTNRIGQVVIGTYNQSDSNQVFIVGQGSSSARKNIFTIDAIGNTVAQGDVYANGTRRLIPKDEVLGYINGLKQDFRIVVDMMPAPLTNTATRQVSTSQSNPFYYNRATGANTQTLTATINAATTITNGGNRVGAINGIIPQQYDPSGFVVSNVTATTSGSVSYTAPTGTLALATQRTLDSGGRIMASYATNDQVVNMMYPSDCEGKLIDKWGNIIYYTATIALNNQQVAKLHPELTDKTCKIYYWTTDNSGTGTNGCYGQKKQLTNFNSSIGAINSGHGTLAIWIYPSIDSTETRTVPVYTGPGTYTMKQVVWGEYIREIFNNPENTFVAWRQTTTQGEMFNGERVWRPQRIEFYGDKYE